MTILVRDKIYFDELQLPPPDTINKATLSATDNELTDKNIKPLSSFSLPGFGLCIDSDCCSSGTEWDPVSYTCVISKDSGCAVPTVNQAAATQVTTQAIPSTTTTQKKEAFTTLDMAYINKDVKNIIYKEKPSLVSNEANEFVDYTVYN